MKTISLFLLFMTYLASPAFAEKGCEQFQQDCEYYSCVEQEKHCGKRGYPIGFGRKYCQRFEGVASKLSEQGKKWMEAVRSCLINKMEQNSSELSCKEFKREAVSHHVPCYVNSGYCELSKQDKKIVIKTIRKSLWRPSLFWAGLKVLKQCKRSVKQL